MFMNAFCDAPLCGVLGIEVERAECFENLELFAPLDIFGQGCGDCVFLGLVVTGAAGLLDEVVVESEVGCHV